MSSSPRHMPMVFACALALSAAAFAGGTGKRVDEWRAPANRARLSIVWVEPSAVSGDVTPPWPFLLYVREASTKKSAVIDNDVLADTSVALAARVCRLVRLTPDQAVSLPYLKQLPRIGNPMLIAVGRDFRVHGTLPDDRKPTAGACLELMAAAVDATSEVPFRVFISSYLGILEESEKAWRDEQQLGKDKQGEVADPGEADRIVAAERAAAAKETELLQRMRVQVVGELQEQDSGLTATEVEALRSYREHASRANPVDAAYALAALRGDSAAMAAAILKEAAKSPWSAWKAGEALAEMRSPAAMRTIRDALSQRGPARAAALAAAARRPLPGCEDVLLALAEDRDPAIREAAIGALGVQRSPAAPPSVLAKALDDPDAGVRVLAARGLGARGGAEHVPALEARLRDPDWCVRRAAAAALASLRIRQSVPPLIDCLGSAEGLLREDALAALVRLTGKTLGPHAAPWRAWWNEAEPRFAPPVKLPAEATFDEAMRGFEWPLSCGSVGTLSNRVAFVVDVGVEMSRKLDLSPHTAEPERSRLREGTKLDLAKADIVDALRSVDLDTSFNIFTFAGKTTAWRDAPARGSTAKASIAWVKGLKALALPPVGSQQSLRSSSTRANPANPHVFRAGEHDVCSAVLDAMGVDPSDPLADRSRPRYDTVFLVIDGHPDGGALQQIPRIAEVVAQLNRSRGVMIHVITFSKVMRSAYEDIAAATGGRHASYGS